MSAHPSSQRAVTRFNLLFAFSFVICFLSFISPAEASSSLEELAPSVQWRRLLQYEDSLFRSARSRSDSPVFLLSENGATDARAELEATVRAFESGAVIDFPLNQPALCAFQGRRAFLEKFGGMTFPKVECVDFDHWYRGVNARRVVLVFSSAFASSPASMFGHIFLRFDADDAKSPAQTTQTRAQSLLSYGLNFAANPDPSDNPITYALKGLLGGYPGVYTMWPYYMLVTQYNHQESRDLWEYELDFNPEELDFLLKLLWEQITTNYTDYFFFDENCASEILELFDIVRPEKNFRARLGVYALPSEVVRIVASEPGFVRSKVFRPSLRRRIETISASEVRAQSNNESRGHAISAKVLHLQYLKQKGKLSEAGASEMDALLRERAKMGVYHEPPSKPTSDPAEARGPRRLTLGLQYRNKEARGLVGYRLGFHSERDVDTGYAKRQAIEYASGLASFRKRTFEIEKFTLARISNYSVLRAYARDLSWIIDFSSGRRVEKDSGSSHNLALTQAVFGFGAGGDDFIVYALGGATAGGGLKSSPYLAPSLVGGLVYDASEEFKFALSSTAEFASVFTRKYQELRTLEASAVVGFGRFASTGVFLEADLRAESRATVRWESHFFY